MVPICQICKEPIWNFFCVDCLAKDIKGWLPPNLRDGFEKFQNQFISYFGKNLDATKSWCLNCKNKKEASICPFCYSNEVICWLKSQDKELFKKFKQIFPFNFEKIGHKEFFRVHGFVEPVTPNTTNKKIFGICDKCGEYAEDLNFVEGEWICESCT